MIRMRRSAAPVRARSIVPTPRRPARSIRATGDDLVADAVAPLGRQLLSLQRRAGNAAVASLVATRPVQRRTEPGEGSSRGGVISPPAPAPSRASTRPGTGVSEHLLSDADKADMPATGDAPAMLAEDRQLYADRAARRRAAAEAKKRGETVDPASTEFTPQEQARVDELDRRLKLRLIGDEEETLKANGVTGGAADWFADVHDVQFLGHTVTVHRLLAERLARAESVLTPLTPPAEGWFKGTSSLRKSGEGLHALGLAVDLNGATNPYIVNPDAAGAAAVENAETSRGVSEILNRAILLVEAKTTSEADFQSRPTNPDKEARAMESYDKLQRASDSLQRYMELDKPENRAALDGYIRALAGKDDRPADRWIAAIRKDRSRLEALAGAKRWTAPQTGFLHLDRRLVEAMTSSAGGGLTWLGDDTIGSGRDIMHFDMRGVGPIRKIVKSAENKTMGLGDG
jgi:hypothetical protein